MTMKTSNQRVVYGQTLLEVGAADPRVVVLEADLGNSTQSIHFQKQFPERTKSALEQRYEKLKRGAA